MSHEVDLVRPALGLSVPDTVAVLETAALAPSVHNAQPWSFRTAPDVVELYADPTRRMPVADPDDQELRLACGAILRRRLRFHVPNVDVRGAAPHDDEDAGLVGRGRLRARFASARG